MSETNDKKGSEPIVESEKDDKPIEFHIPAIRTAITSLQVSEEVWKLGQNPKLIDYILSDLDKKVKRDLPCKLSSFFTGLSSYSNEPINETFKGESGSGKSYNVVQTMRYFPTENDALMLLIGMSPKVLVHGHGILCDQKGVPILTQDKPIRPNKRDFAGSQDEYKQAMSNYQIQKCEWDERNSNAYFSISLHNKIMVFLQPPSEETVEMLLPILSHDTPRHEYKYVDPNTMQAIKIVLDDWPAAIFLDTSLRYMWELSTRCFTVSPEVSKEKIGDANELANLQVSEPWNYDVETEETKLIKQLLEILKREVTTRGLKVLIPFENLHEIFPRDMVRDMRDFKHFLHLIKSVTLLYTFQRPLVQKDKSLFILSAADDVVLALHMFAKIFETTRTGTQENILNFYYNVVQKRLIWTIQDLTEEYNTTITKPISSNTIWKWMKRLYQISYVEKQRGMDGRVWLWSPLKKEKETIGNVCFVVAPTILRENLGKSAETWLNKRLIELPQLLWKKKEDGILTLVETSSTEVLDLLKKDCLEGSQYGFQRFLTEISALKTEKRQEEVGADVKQTIPTISSQEYVEGVCSVCGSKALVKNGTCDNCRKEEQSTTTVDKLPIITKQETET